MSILKSSFVVSAWTMGSRVLGFLRDVLIANKLGASAASDAFFIALIIPNLLRRLFAEGAFNVAFVPLLARIHDSGDKKEAESFSGAVLSVLTLVLLFITIMAEIFMPWVVGTVIAPGVKDNVAAFETTVFLCRISFPYLMLITFASLAGSICNTWGKFAPFAFVPMLLNVSLIACIIILPMFGYDAATAATIAIPLGGIIQALFMCWALTSIPFRLRFNCNFKHESIKPLLIRIGPAALSIGILQISFLIDMHLASYLGDKAISYLNYANRFYQLPLALIGVALATVLLPHFSRHLKQKDFAAASSSYTSALTYGLALALASTAGLFILAEDLMSVLFGHGEFDQQSVVMSAYAMMAFCMGLPAFIITKVTITAFYANEDTKTPVKISMYSLIVNVMLSVILMQYWGHIGIAAATAISGWCNSSLQIFFLNRQGFIKITDKNKFYVDLGKSIVITLMMILGLMLFKMYMPEGEGFILNLLWLIGAVITGISVFIITAHTAKLFCVKSMFESLKR